MRSTSLPLPKRLALVGATALAATVAAMGIQPAGAVGTTTTFTLAGGSIATTTPNGSSDLGSALPVAGTVVGALEAVTVADTRGALVASWTTTATITDFTTGTATADETIGASAVSYTAGVLTPSIGAAAGVPGVGVTGFDEGAKTVMTATAVGSNTSSFIPTLTITIPATAVAGTYTGTVTHSTS